MTYINKILFGTILLFSSISVIHPQGPGPTYWDYTIFDGDEILVDSMTPTASSALKGPKNDPNCYLPRMVIDNNIKTSWVEGKNNDGIGEKLVLIIPFMTKKISIANGVQYSPTLFKKNNRVKNITVNIYTGHMSGVSQMTNRYKYFFFQKFNFKLNDSKGFQNITIPIDWKSFYNNSDAKQKELISNNIIKKDFDSKPVAICIIIIDSIYKGTKYNDTAISEIIFSK